MDFHMDIKSFEGAPMVYNKNIFCYWDKGYNELKGDGIVLWI